MVFGHSGDPGADAVWLVAVDIRLAGGCVPIIFNEFPDVVAKDLVPTPNYATETVVQA